MSVKILLKHFTFGTTGEGITFVTFVTLADGSMILHSTICVESARSNTRIQTLLLYAS